MGHVITIRDLTLHPGILAPCADNDVNALYTHMAVLILSLLHSRDHFAPIFYSTLSDSGDMYLMIEFKGFVVEIVRAFLSRFSYNNPLVSVVILLVHKISNIPRRFPYCSFVYFFNCRKKIAVAC